MSKLDWATSDERLLLCIKGGRGLESKEGSAPDPFVEVKENTEKKSKVILETKVAKKDSNPTWNHLHFVAGCPQLTFKVWDKGAIGKDFIGQVIFNDVLQQNPHEVVCDEWYQLGLREKDKKQKAQGQLRVSWVRSSHPVNRTLLPNDYSYYLWYHHHKDKINTGDLIVYSGTSIIDSTIKVLSGSNYSNVGFVISLPSKWTGNRELYVVECSGSPNTDLDGIAQTKRSGICIYKLSERIHSFHGDAIWWAKLNANPDDGAKLATQEFLLNLHAKRPLTDYKEKTQDENENLFKTPKFLAEASSLWLDHGCDTKKDPSLCHQIYSPQLVAIALKQLGVQLNDENLSDLMPVDIVNLEVYKNNLRLIRCGIGTKDYHVGKLSEKLSPVEFKAGKSTSDFVGRTPSDASFTSQQQQIDMFKAMVSWSPGQPLPAGLIDSAKPPKKHKSTKKKKKTGSKHTH